MSTPYMGLTLPVVSSTPGPLYASENNQAFLVVDAHDHAPGNGLPIPSSGINLNADLPFNTNNATLLRSTRYVSQVSPLSLPADLTCIYVSGGNLYYNNQIGQQVQITAGAALNATSIGGIGGDYATSTASVFYTSVDSTFTFWSAPNTSADIDAGCYTMRNQTPSAPGFTQCPSPTLSSNVGVFWFNALPASTKILTVDSAGNIADVYDVDNSTLEVVANNIQVKNNGITTAKIADANVTRPKLVPVGQIKSSSSVSSSYTNSGSLQQISNLSISITTTGRPVVVGLESDGGGLGTPSGVYFSNTNNPSGQIVLRKDTVQIRNYICSGGVNETIFGPMLLALDTPVAGTYTYDLQFYNPGGGGAVGHCDYMILYAYEL